MATPAEVAKTVSPLAKSLGLVFGNATIGTVDAMMRTVASLAPGSSLGGATDTDKALVEGWMTFVWSSLDMPLSVLVNSKNEPTEKGFLGALATLESHCSFRHSW